MREGETRGLTTSVARTLDTLTFLFTDLRDYTAFVESRGDAAATSLIGEYRRLVRGEVDRAGGGEIKTEGDSFYVVFGSAHAAVRCGITILREAERRSRPDFPLRVGIGIHAGEPLPHEGQYVGSAVNVAARLAQAAGPGELLVSELVRGLLRTSGGSPMQERTGIVLKGIVDPPRVFAIGWREAPTEREETPTATAPSVRSEPVERNLVCPDLIGREAELARLVVLLGAARAGQGRAVLVAGEAGMGKSAFLRRFAERARASGVRFLLGECTELESRRPFGPFVDIMRAASRELAASGFEERLRSSAAELLRLMPERSGGAEIEEALGDVERYRIHSAFARLLGELADAVPIVIAIEDLHWGDEASLELFPYLARKLRDRPLLLLATYRSDELHRLHPLRRVLADLSRSRLAEEIALHPLTIEEVGDVMRGAMSLNRAPTVEFREAIYERSEGNPLFVEEVLKALADRGDLQFRDGRWTRAGKPVREIAIPDSVRDAVQQRVAMLREDERRALQFAAVIGQRFDFELLAQVAELSERDLVRALRSALDAQLVVAETDERGDERYAFRHALTRESVLAELLQRERRVMHRAVAEAIESSSRSDPAARAEELAYHFDEARDTAKAFAYHDLAASESSRVFAHRRALGHLERAVEFAPDDPMLLGGLQVALGETSWHAGDVARAGRAFESARQAFLSAGDTRQASRCLSRIARTRWYLGDTAGSTEAAQAAIRALEPLGTSRELAAAYAESARLAMLDWRDVEAIETGDRAVVMARQTNAMDVLSDALNTIGLAHAHLLDPSGTSLLRESLDIALSHQLVQAAQRAYFNLWTSGNWFGDPDESRRVHAEAMEHAHRHGLRLDQEIVREATYALADGDLDRVLRLSREAGESVFGAVVQLLEAFARVAREGPSAEAQPLDGPQRRLQSASASHRLWGASIVAQTRMLADDASATLEAVEQVGPLLRAGHGPRVALNLGIMAIVASERAGDPAGASAWAEFLESRLRGKPAMLETGHTFAEASRVAATDRDRAIALLARCEELVDQELFPFMRTLIRLRRAELLVARGAPDDRETAMREIAPLVEFWRRAGAKWYLNRLAKWAGERGIPFPTA